MQKQELILTCESCGQVIRTHIENEDQIEEILNSHPCENNCKSEYRSYIIIGTVHLSKEYTFPAAISA